MNTCISAISAILEISCYQHCDWEKRNKGTTQFVALSNHVSIYCFLGISLVLDYIFPDEIEHLCRIYAVARFDSRQQLILESSMHLWAQFDFRNWADSNNCLGKTINKKKTNTPLFVFFSLYLSFIINWGTGASLLRKSKC